MKRLKTGAGDFEISVRRDQKKAKQRMTRDTHFQKMRPRSAEKSGDWVEWWQAGCGRDGNGKSACPPGHAYTISRYYRGAHRRSKVLGRRRERRKLNKLTAE